MKSSEFITEAVNVRSKNKEIVSILVSLGCKVDEREQSAGALKTWLRHGGGVNNVSSTAMVTALAAKFPGTRIDDDDDEPNNAGFEIRGPGFTIEKQGPRTLFLAVHAGPKAKEYAMGLDEDNVESDMQNTTKRQARLKAEIEAGYAPVVHNTSSSAEPVYTMGDVEALGWMTKDYHTERYGPDDYDTTWTRYYHREAPGPIRVQTSGGREPQVWQPGFQEQQ